MKCWKGEICSNVVLLCIVSGNFTFSPYRVTDTQAKMSSKSQGCVKSSGKGQLHYCVHRNTQPDKLWSDLEQSIQYSKAEQLPVITVKR